MPNLAEPTAAPLRTESPVCAVGVDWGTTLVEGRVARTRPVFTPGTQRGNEPALREMDRNQCLPGHIVGGDVAQMAQLLAADDSPMITAQEFFVDAEWT